MGYHSMMYYMEPPIRRLDSYQELLNRLEENRPTLILAFEPRLPDLENLGDCRKLRVLDLTHTDESLTLYPIHLVELTPNSAQLQGHRDGHRPAAEKIVTTTGGTAGTDSPR
jgi:hypothetical protein